MDSYDFLYDMVKHYQTLPLNREARIVLRGNEMDFVLQTVNSEIIVTIKSVVCLEDSFIINDQVKVKLRDESQ